MSASHAQTIGGTVFLGRYNGINNGLDDSQNIVFAVGTGTSNTARKTGLLIDSGSNTFIEGTLNISGAVSQSNGRVTFSAPLFVGSTPTLDIGGPDRNDISLYSIVDLNVDFTGDVKLNGKNVNIQGDNPTLTFRDTSAPSASVLQLRSVDSELQIFDIGVTPNVTIASFSTSSAQILEPTRISGSLTVTGSVTIQSGSGDLFVHGHKQFHCGAFQSNVTQSGSANVSQSVNFDTTDVSYGVTLSDGSKLNIQNAGVYLLTFSAQVLADSGADTIYLWIKKNGTNVPESATKLTLANNDAEVATVTFVNEVAANDYYEVAWQTTNGDAVLYTEAATGNIPAIPSIIVTITQVR